MTAITIQRKSFKLGNKHKEIHKKDIKYIIYMSYKSVRQRIIENMFIGSQALSMNSY